MNTEKEKRAIAYLKHFEPESEPYYLCYSGGKDSDVIRILADLAGVKHEIHHSLTTADAPETVRYVKSIPGVIIDQPELTMWQLIVKKQVPPTRLIRYCCTALKERGGKGRLKITGVRWAESVNRKKNGGLIKILGKPKSTIRAAEEAGLDYDTSPKGGMILNTDNDENRRFVEQCYRTHSAMINPIVDWTDDDVWEFLHHYGCDSNPLYCEGFSRIGCIGCPMAGTQRRKEEFTRYPKYKVMYVHAFDRMLEARKQTGKETQWNTGEEVFDWWLGE